MKNVGKIILSSGTMELTRHLVPHLKAQGGLVVNISSLQGRIAIPHRAAYAASKHALQAWSDSLRAELACQGVDVLVVSPGYVKTELSRNAITEQVKLRGGQFVTFQKIWRNEIKVTGQNFRALLMERWMPAQRRATVLLGWLRRC